MAKKPKFTDEFKQGVVEYILEHPDESKLDVARRFGVGDSTIHAWLKQYNSQNNSIKSRGSGNYSSEAEKENARLKKELRDTKDALDVLKKAIGILGE